MRQIAVTGQLPQAQLFSDYLISQGIENEVRPETHDLWSLWVYDDALLERAQGLWQGFLKNPAAAIYQQAMGASHTLKQKQKAEERQAKKNFINVRRQWRWPLGGRMGPVTITLMAISILVSIATGLGKNTEIYPFLYITGFEIDGSYISWNRGLDEILHGEIWRLFTPMFLHFGILHILFNMMWLKDLGSVIEVKHGSPYFLAMVLAISALSNVAQFYVSGPMFGGMSGVVYGLLGYLWIRGKFDLGYGMRLNPQVVTMMIVWFFVCLTGLLGPIANTAHGAGLASGALWGYAASRHWRRL